MLTIPIDRELGSVEFVRDYIMLHFDGPTLTAYNLPVIHNLGKITRQNEPGYHDLLCAQIGKKSLALEIEEGVELIVCFENDVRLSISLRETDKHGPEAAIYYESSEPKNKWWVW